MMRPLEKRIETSINAIYRKYDIKPKISQVLYIKEKCLEDVKKHPKLEDALKSSRTVNVFVTQNILENIKQKDEEQNG